MNRNFLLFLLIFLLAAAFRITNLDLIEFKTDEAVNLLLASRPLFGYGFPPGGTVSSIGVLNPPLFNYIIFPLTAISLDPKFISFFIGLTNSLAVAFLFLIIKRYYGLSIALISTILLSLSPWAIIYSRKIWMQDLLIPFFLPVFYSVHKLVIEKKAIYWLPYSIFSLILIQLHPISFVFISILTIFILFQKVKLNLRYIILGLFIGLIPLIPYLVYEFKNNCPDCQALIYARNKLSFRYSPEIFFRPLQILSQGNFRFILEDDTLTFSQRFPLTDTIRRIFYFEYLIIPLGIVLFLKKFRNFKFLAYSIITLPFVYFILKLEPFMHYYIITIPVLFLFLAVGFNSLIFNKNLFLKFGSRTLLIVIIIASISFNATIFELLRSKGSFRGDYGIAFYKSEKEIKDKITQFKKQSDYNEIFLASFIPLNYTYGYLPHGRILYGEISEVNLLKLEEKLKEDSKDPRVKQKIIAFYTKKAPTLETLDVLRNKKNDIPQYEPLYNLVLSDYLSKNFKKEHRSVKLGIKFFYPEHWTVKETNTGILINGDGYLVYIKKSEREKTKVECISLKNKCKMEVINDIETSIRFL